MHKSVLLLVSLTFVVCLSPSVSLGKAILPPPCCDWNESTASPQTVVNQEFSLIPEGIASLSGGLVDEQEVLFFRIPGDQLVLESPESKALNIADLKASFRITPIRKNAHSPEIAAS
jgi:hypothetical protein